MPSAKAQQKTQPKTRSKPSGKAVAVKFTAKPTAKPIAKSTANAPAKKQGKVLSEAATKRLEQERLDAQKTKTKKLAESIKRRSTELAKHDTVAKNLDTVKAAAKKTKNYKLRPVEKVRQPAPMKRDTEFDLFQARLQERNHEIHRLLHQATVIKNRLDTMAKRETVKFHEALRDCYGIYQHIQSTPEPYAFFDVLRDYFKMQGTAQSNSPDEGLLVRFVFTQKSNKQISEYATVIRYALDTKISTTNFIHWYTTTTQTRILQKARKAGNTKLNDRLQRARVLLQRYFDLREQWPLGEFDYPEMLAEKQVHLPDDLVIVICRGVRRFNRDVEFNAQNPSRSRLPMASISALHFIPPTIDLANDIIDRIARYLEPRLEQFEEEIQQKTEQVWSEDMTHFLMERELGAAYRSADRWADRMQAALHEEQQAIEQQRRAIQKLRNKARK